MAAPIPPSSLTTRPDHVRVGQHKVSTEILDTLRQASRSAGVDFAYLVSQAAQESGFRTDAQARTSSARGMFQFIESTWLEMVRDNGAKYGLADQAAKITTGSDGRPRVADPADRQTILALRDDPRIAAAMAAEYARGNQAMLSREFGVEVGKTELYLGHFLGSNGATKFLTALRDRPDMPAADLLPDAAAANSGVFFDSMGRKRSVSDIHAYFTRKLEAHAEGLEQVAETPSQTTAYGPQGTGATSVAQQMAETRASVDHMAKMMAFEALRDLMMRAGRIGRNNDSSW
ncbi:hypothetical protein [Ferrovibrio sp.]|uniref:hypothetical protein n=1 Tax=Ferrovibrio sp. TaxID=1917215 RepID=UPI003D1302FB